MHLSRLYFYIIFTFSTLLSFAQEGFYPPPHSLYTEEVNTLESNEVFVYRDDNGDLLIEDLLNLKPSDYIKLNDISLFNKEAKYWAYYRLANKSDSDMSFVLHGGRNSKETYYFFSGVDRVVRRTGYRFPSDDRNIKQGHQTRVNLTLPANKLTHVFVKIESLDNNPIDIQVELIPTSQWTSGFKNINLFQGVFTGVLIVITVLAFFIYGFTGERVFLYFGIYALLNVIYFLHIHGIIELHLLPRIVDPIPALWIVPLLGAASYFTFARYFLETKTEFPKWDVALSILAYFSLGAFVVDTTYILLTGDMYLGMIAFLFSLLLLSLCTIFLIYSTSKSSNIIAKYFAYGTLFLIGSILIVVIDQIQNPSNDLPLLVQVGILVEIVIFSLGISHKLKRQFEDHDITQRSLILQLRKNEDLQLDINQELEEIVADRTQQIKKQNKELKAARQVAEKATKDKSDFLSVMSHEIRTPLNAIISLSHIMELDNQDEEMQEYINALKFSSESLHSLINDILDYNKIEAGKLRLESIEFSLIDLLKNLAQSFKYKANNKGIEMRIEIGEHLPDRLFGDPTRLTQILNNLIGNAVKFTNEGYVHIKATLAGIKDETATVSFSLQDTGIGIPEDKLKAIFEEYEQASDETTREYGGTGLGLSIVKKLLNMMGSSIELSSLENKGTTFFFDIDFKIDPEFDLVDLQQEERDKDLNSKSILVVDDNDMNRLVLKRLFQIWNGNFDEADNGFDAIEKSNNVNYDVILMDLEMKPMNGFTAALELQKTQMNSNTPVIAMSAHNPLDFEIEFKESGFVDFVHKPFDPEELFQKLTTRINQEDVE